MAQQAIGQGEQPTRPRPDVAVITLNRPDELNAPRHCAVLWANLEALPEADRNGSLADAYAWLFDADDPLVREKAARDWCDWEASHVDVDGTRPPPLRYVDARYRMCFARLVTHYWRHAAWLDDGELLRNVARIACVPAVLIHGRIDLSSPPDIAWQLAQAWPAAQLYIVPGVGHSSGDAMSAHLVDFLNGFAEAISDS